MIFPYGELFLLGFRDIVETQNLAFVRMYRSVPTVTLMKIKK